MVSLFYELESKFNIQLNSLHRPDYQVVLSSSLLPEVWVNRQSVTHLCLSEETADSLHERSVVSSLYTELFVFETETPAARLAFSLHSTFYSNRKLLLINFFKVYIYI